MQAEAQEDWILRVFAARAGSELERLHAEERLRESEARARTLLESHFDGVVLVVDGRIVYANRALWQLAGFPSAEALVGRSPEDFVVAAQREQLRQQMADDLSGNGTLAPTEYLGVTIDGSTVPVEVLGRRIDFEGSPAILAAVRDITERKQVERERRELEHQLAKSQRLRSVGQLAAGVVEWLEGKISWESPRGPAGVPSRPEGSPCPAEFGPRMRRIGEGFSPWRARAGRHEDATSADARSALRTLIGHATESKDTVLDRGMSREIGAQAERVRTPIEFAEALKDADGPRGVEAGRTHEPEAQFVRLKLLVS